MAGKTIEDLKALRAQLVERRRQEAYWAVGTGPYNETGLAKLALVDRAIEALDAVIAEGKDEPEEVADALCQQGGFRLTLALKRNIDGDTQRTACGIQGG